MAIETGLEETRLAKVVGLILNGMLLYSIYLHWRSSATDHCINSVLGVVIWFVIDCPQSLKLKCQYWEFVQNSFFQFR